VVKGFGYFAYHEQPRKRQNRSRMFPGSESWMINVTGGEDHSYFVIRGLQVRILPVRKVTVAQPDRATESTLIAGSPVQASSWRHKSVAEFGVAGVASLGIRGKRMAWRGLTVPRLAAATIWLLLGGPSRFALRSSPAGSAVSLP